MIMNGVGVAAAARGRWRAGAILVPAICVGGAALVVGCGKGKVEQCKVLVEAVERADGVRAAPDFSSREARKKYFDALVATKRELSAVQVSDERLVVLRDAEAKNLEDFMFAQREIEDSLAPSQLTKATEKREKVIQKHESTTAELGAYCEVAVALPSRAQGAAPGTASVAGTASGTSAPGTASAAGSTSAPGPEQWLTFRHPTLPFEAQYFEAPEVGERKGPNSITSAAIADDENRMFSAAHIVLQSPAVYDCKAILETHVKGKQDRFKCRRTQEATTPLNGAPTLEVTLECGDGATMLKRVSCMPKQAEKTVLLFDVEAIYLRAWNPTEARRFVDSAKISSR